MTALQKGDAAPQVSLHNMDDEKVDLGQFWQDGRIVLLIFLRHLN